jgi:hypothetical protein
LDTVDNEAQLAAVKHRLVAQAAALQRLFMRAFADMLQGKTRFDRDMSRALKAPNQCRIALNCIARGRAVRKKIAKSNKRTIGERKTPSRPTRWRHASDI